MRSLSSRRFRSNQFAGASFKQSSRRKFFCISPIVAFHETLDLTSAPEPAFAVSGRIIEWTIRVQYSVASPS